MSVAIEHFFTPNRRFRDICDTFLPPFEYTEVELNVPVEDFLSYQWGWEDLCAFVNVVNDGAMRKLLWIAKDAFLVTEYEENDYDFDFVDSSLHICIAAMLRATSGQEHTLVLMQDSTRAHPTGACNVFWRAITTSNMVQLSIQDCRYFPGKLPSGPILSQFFRDIPLLQVLQIRGFDFKEEHCRALATLERTGLEVKLTDCKLEPEGTEFTFIEWFRHNKVVTELNYCVMGSRIFSALSGNNSVKRLSINYDEEQMRCLLLALPGNMGIEHLTVRAAISPETWSLLFRSMSRHPRLESLSLPLQTNLSAGSKTSRMQAVLEMLRHNTVVRTIDLADEFRDVEIYLNAILPRLEMNRSYFEVQRQAMKQADPSIRPQLLGRALHAVQYNPELVFRFLSENVPAFVRTEQGEEGSAIIPLENDPAIISGQKKRKAP